MDLLAQPLRTVEFLAVDTETNGLGGDGCEVTEVGAVLVGGGELHDRFASLCAVRAPLSRGVQRLTGITQAMVDEAPEAEIVLADLVAALEGRVLVAHNAAFDRRVLRQACERRGLVWPDPPAICTVALARRFAPLARQRRLVPLAESLGIEVTDRHRALADAETCGRVFCALLPRLAAHAPTVGDALALLKPARAARSRAAATDGGRHGARRRRAGARSELMEEPAGRETALDSLAGARELPDEPGVYIFRNAGGQPLYVGKSIALRTRVRSHFAASSDPSAWTAQAASVDYQQAASELGALVLENRLIKRLAPPGNVRLKHQDRFVYLRCRLDIAFPVLEVAPAPASGHAVSVGPLRGRAVAAELVEQLNSLFGLRHCGRKLPRRQWPSAYGQMGRCLSPCLGDLDPNLYRRRLDEALALFTGQGDGGAALLAHIDAETRAAAGAQRYERAAWLRRRRARLEQLLSRLDGVLGATHARPKLVRAPHPRDEGRGDLFWLVGGRVVDWCPSGPDDLAERTAAALRHWDPRRPTGHLPAGEVDEARIVAGWVATNAPPQLTLDPVPDSGRLAAFAA
ncbi:exonuclease domain-containing protein [Capillimicrobium parvum]|uniref:UvrABC system protein C n=1 Tax=Capillimicrobium parvum TaxID=2884022 RepID=A0A9E6XVX6_9ACTN|nr:exonuclease domain-containing protein [Capillimicrobium parvum]UGS35462.1 UvrABC system protein C [Capillimicrobium parvum]